jgi:hypothetical protein
MNDIIGSGSDGNHGADELEETDLLQNLKDLLVRRWDDLDC